MRLAWGRNEAGRRTDTIVVTLRFAILCIMDYAKLHLQAIKRALRFRTPHRARVGRFLVTVRLYLLSAISVGLQSGLTIGIALL